MKPNYGLKAAIISRYGVQSKFAQLVKIREARLSNIICGRTEPTKAEQKTIAKKLGVQINEVFPQN